MSSFLGTWYLSLMPAAVAVAMSLYAVRQMKGVLAQLPDGLRRRDQLALVKGAIEANMRQAALYVVLYALLLVALFAGVGLELLGLPALALHLIAFGVVTGPFGLWTRQYEKRLQRLDTAGAEPGVAEVYSRWLVEWKKPRLRLSEP